MKFTCGNLAAFIKGVKPARSLVFGCAPNANNNSMHCRSNGETRLISEPKKYLLFGLAPASSSTLATSTCRFLRASRSGSSHKVVLRKSLESLKLPNKCKAEKAFGNFVARYARHAVSYLRFYIQMLRAYVQSTR